MFVEFKNFWGGFEPKVSFFWDFIEYLGKEPKLSEVVKAVPDVRFVSVFAPRPSLIWQISKKVFEIDYRNNSVSSVIKNRTIDYSSNGATRDIWYSGENVRPPFDSNFDLTMSVDQDDYDGRNLYFPPWYLYLNWFTDKKYNDRSGCFISTDELIRARQIPDNLDKRKLSCAFIGKPTELRNRVIAEIRKFGEIDVFGAFGDRIVSKKSDVSNGYKFMVCFENDLYPGYVSEKLLEAYVSGCIPIYWGDLGINEFLNEAAFINLRNFPSMRGFLEHIRELDIDAIAGIYQEPLLKAVPNIQLLDPLRKVITF